MAIILKICDSISYHLIQGIEIFRYLIGIDDQFPQRKRLNDIEEGNKDCEDYSDEENYEHNYSPEFYSENTLSENFDEEDESDMSQMSVISECQCGKVDCDLCYVDSYGSESSEFHKEFEPTETFEDDNTVRETLSKIVGYGREHEMIYDEAFDDDDDDNNNNNSDNNKDSYDSNDNRCGAKKISNKEIHFQDDSEIVKNDRRDIETGDSEVKSLKLTCSPTSLWSRLSRRFAFRR